MTGFALSRFQDPLRPGEGPGVGRGLTFSLIAHGLLVIALSLGVAWHTSTPPAFEAELWSAVPQAAAPKAVEPPPAPEPEVKPEPRPPQPSAEDLQAQREADIAATKAKEAKKRKDQEDRDKALEKKRQDEKKAADEKKKLDDKKQERLEKLKAEKAAKAADAKREALRQENLKRIMGQAGATGTPTATGTAQRSSGPSSSYAGRIIARVRPNIIYGDLPLGNPAADVEVRVAPDGTIIGRKLVKPSGDPDWDRAVLRAIDKTEILPRDTDGSVQPLMVLTFRPRD